MGIRGKIIQAKNCDRLYMDYKAHPQMFYKDEGARQKRMKEKLDSIVAQIDF